MANNRELSQFASFVSSDSGRVGINTDTFPDARDSLIVAPPSGQTDVFFTIKTLSTNGNTRLQFADPDDTNVGDISYTHSNNAMVFKTSDTERLRVSSNGRVGINSISPATALDIQSTKNTDGLTVTKAGTRSVFLGHNGSGNEGILVLKENGTTNVQIYAETNQNSYINSGNFGIGTNSPSYKLDVRPTAEDPTTGSPAAGSFSQIRADDATVGKGPSLSLMNLSGSKETGWRLSALTASGNNGDFTIHGYGGGATYTERLRIASDGQATFDKGAPNSANQVIARFQAESSRRLDIVWHDSGSLLGFDLPGSHSYTFKTGGTERLRITSDGRLHVGDSLGNNHAGMFQVIHEGGGNQTNDCLAFFETNANDWCIITNSNEGGSANHYHMYFMEEGTVRGSIAGSHGQNVTYGQGSDYRYKENIIDLTGTEGIDICKRLRPRKYNWIKNREGTGQINTVDGFIAHEVQEGWCIRCCYW